MAQYVEVLMPLDQQEGTESVVGQWLKEAGQPVQEHEPLLEINTDKVVVEIPCPASGSLAECLVQPGDPVQPGQQLGRIRVGSAVTKEAESEPVPVTAAARATVSAQESAAPAASPELRLSPAVRRALKENALDPALIEGTGRRGRITYQDVTRYLTAEPQAARQAAEPPALAAGPAGSGAPGSVQVRPHTPMRKAIAQHMLESVRTSPHVTAIFEADFSAVMADREGRRALFEKRGVKLTYTAYLVSAAAQALVAVPEVNSQWGDLGLKIFADCNIGVAIGLGEQGLVVPVIRQAQSLNLFGIASRLQELTGRAREGKLEATELEGGTFTITNHGVSGSLIATPLIHQPQSAILGVGKVEKRLIVLEGPSGDSIVIRPLAYVTLTIDHRALDGFTANRWLQSFVEALQDWPN